MVNVVSATSLKPEEVKALQEALKTTDIHYSVNPLLIAGLRITVNGQTIDYSLRAKLNQLQTQLT